MNGFGYDREVIKERRGTEAKAFFLELKKFVEANITRTIIEQDINTLLPYDKFKKIRLVLKKETLMFLNDEIKRLGGADRGIVKIIK